MLPVLRRLGLLLRFFSLQILINYCSKIIYYLKLNEKVAV